MNKYINKANELKATIKPYDDIIERNKSELRHNHYLSYIMGYIPLTNYDVARLEAAINILNYSTSSGKYGEILELLNRKSNSKITTVDKNNGLDFKVSLSIDGEVKQVMAECKSSGGRIGSKMPFFLKNPYPCIVYDFVHDNSTAKKGVRECNAVLFLASDFIKLCKLKHTNGVNDEYAIELSNKAFKEAVCAQYNRIGEYDRNKTYDINDIKIQGL